MMLGWRRGECFTGQTVMLGTHLFFLASYLTLLSNIVLIIWQALLTKYENTIILKES